MQTRISDMVERLFLFINQLPDEKNYKPHILIESKLSLAKLTKVLVQYKNLTAEVTPTNVEAFKSFLSARWQCIKGTDAIYMHNPGTPINQACIQLANELSAVFHASPYDFLMPSLKSMLIKTSKGTLADLQLAEFIMGDDDEPIEVMACLDNYRKSNQLLATSEKQPNKRLGTSEINRIINHSDDAHAYYIAILTGSPEDQLDACRKKMLASSGYQRVNASYDKEGDRRLTTYICTSIGKSAELINLMLNHIPKYKWLEFVKEISSHDLFRIILDMNPKDVAPDRLAIQKLLSVKFTNLTARLSEGRLTSIEKERRVRAWLLCVVMVYQHERQNGSDYTSYRGQVVGYLSFWTGTTQYTGVYSEKEKLDASNKLIDVILSDTPLSSIKSLLTVGALNKFSGPLQFGTLGWIVQEISKLGEYFEKDKDVEEKDVPSKLA